MTATHGLGFLVTARVDSDCAGNTVTQRYSTGFIIYVNSVPVYWMTKKQTSCESFYFGGKFVAMKKCCEYICGIQYELNKMVIEVDGPAYIFVNKNMFSVTP